MEQRFGGSDPEWSREPTDEERRAMLEKGAVDMEYFESGKGEEDLTAIHEAVLQTDPELSRQVADRLMSGRDPR